MKKLLEYLLNNMFDKNTMVVEEENQNGVVNLIIKAPKDSIGKVIGKGGKTINSIKNVLKIKAIKDGTRVEIQVVEQ